MHPVFLLGAGYSKAVSASMPVMADLGKSVASALEGRVLPGARPTPQVDVEIWLSYALEEQPFLTTEQNLLNRAAAAAAIDALQSTVVQCQYAAERDGVAEWLQTLLCVWHGSRAEVITLNWDTLVERAVESVHLLPLVEPVKAGAVGRVTSEDILGHVPRLSPGSISGGPGYTQTTFRLHKLHGSIDWYWSEGDPYDETVVRRPSARAVLGDTAGVAGKVPFFAAPTATKAQYYRNQVIRHVWRRARRALEATQDLTLIGYSLPKSDLAVHALLGGYRGRRVRIVDTHAHDVAGRVESVLGSDVEMELFNSIDDFVSAARLEFATRGSPAKLQAWTGARSDPVVATVCADRSGAVTAVEVRPEGTYLVVDEWRDSIHRATAVDAGAGPVSAAEVVDCCTRRGPVFVRSSDEARRVIYDATLLRLSTGRSATWMNLSCEDRE